MSVLSDPQEHRNITIATRQTITNVRWRTPISLRKTLASEVVDPLLNLDLVGGIITVRRSSVPVTPRARARTCTLLSPACPPQQHVFGQSKGSASCAKVEVSECLVLEAALLV